MPQACHFSHSLFTSDRRLADQAAVAKQLNVTLNEVRGAWMAWLFFKDGVDLDSVTPENLAEQGSGRRVTVGDADTRAQLIGFAHAFAAVGWLEITPDHFVLSSPAAREQSAMAMAAKARKLEARKADEERQRQDIARKNAVVDEGPTNSADSTATASPAPKPSKEERRAAYEAKTGKPATIPKHERTQQQDAPAKPATTLAEVRRAQKEKSAT